MLFIQAAVGDSAISGKGLFAQEPVRKGTVVSIHAVDSVVVTEEQYQEEQRKGNELAIRTGIRWVENIFYTRGRAGRKRSSITRPIRPCSIIAASVSRGATLSRARSSPLIIPFFSPKKTSTASATPTWKLR